VIFINEWLPNPVGADAQGEFVELWNSGTASVNLNGWTLRTNTQKRFRLTGSLRANEYLVLSRKVTKLALKNTDGELFLYDATGVLADRSNFEGGAPEGKSFNRIHYVAYRSSGVQDVVQQFVWGRPTPGVKNEADADTAISEISYPVGVPLARDHLSRWSVAALALAAGVIFGVALWYAMKKDETFAQLFFGGNGKVRG
jgi:hypothetical protein